jgi:hypothetical protein
MRENPPLHVPQVRARLETELDEASSQSLEDIERVGLPPAQVEGMHELDVQPLAQRMLCNERFELRHEGGVGARSELRVEARLQGGEPKLLETTDLRLRPALVGELGVRLAAEACERIAQ